MASEYERTAQVEKREHDRGAAKLNKGKFLGGGTTGYSNPKDKAAPSLSQQLAARKSRIDKAAVSSALKETEAKK